MATDVCAVCGKPLAARSGRTGRGSVYCSAACRQKAYRERRQPRGLTVQGLIDDIGRRAGQLAPEPADVLYATVGELSESVARLRRVARTVRDTTQDAGDSVTADAVTQRTEAAPGTHLTETEFGALTEQYRREIQVHCYRMTGSYDEAEDLVQETFCGPGGPGTVFRGGRARGPGCTGSPPTPLWTCCDGPRAARNGTNRCRGCITARGSRPPVSPGCSPIPTTRCR